MNEMRNALKTKQDMNKALNEQRLQDEMTRIDNRETELNDGANLVKADIE